MASTNADESTPWQGVLDEDRFERDIVAALRGRSAETLQTAPLASGPGTYLILYSGRHPTLGPVAEPSFLPVYVGSALSLHARRGRHLLTIAATDLDAADFYVVALRTLRRAASLAAEHALIDALEPLFNQSWMAGFGSRQPGATRRGVPSPFDTLFPGRRWATHADPAMASRLRERAVAYATAQRRKFDANPLGVLAPEPRIQPHCIRVAGHRSQPPRTQEVQRQPDSTAKEPTHRTPHDPLRPWRSSN